MRAGILDIYRYFSSLTSSRLNAVRPIDLTRFYLYLPNFTVESTEKSLYQPSDRGGTLSAARWKNNSFNITDKMNPATRRFPHNCPHQYPIPKSQSKEQLSTATSYSTLY